MVRTIYDISKTHRGNIKVFSSVNNGTELIIKSPDKA
jgi:hypothetical protein